MKVLVVAGNVQEAQWWMREHPGADAKVCMTRKHLCGLAPGRFKFVLTGTYYKNHKANELVDDLQRHGVHRLS